MAQANTPMLLNSILINLSKLLRSDEFGSEENIIIGEDFNCPLDITLDKKGGLPISGKYAK